MIRDEKPDENKRKRNQRTQKNGTLDQRHRNCQMYQNRPRDLAHQKMFVRRCF